MATFKSTAPAIKMATAAAKKAPTAKSAPPKGAGMFATTAATKPGNVAKANTAKKVTAMKKTGGVYSGVSR